MQTPKRVGFQPIKSSVWVAYLTKRDDVGPLTVYRLTFVSFFGSTFRYFTCLLLRILRILSDRTVLHVEPHHMELPISKITT